MTLKSFLLCGSAAMAAVIAPHAAAAQDAGASTQATGAQSDDRDPQAQAEADEAKAAAEAESDTSAQAQQLLTGKPAAAKKAARKARRGEAVGEDDGPQVSNEDGRLTGDVVVVGLRENTASARNAKRRASQIVEVVLAQDIGKLPDRNVTEAISRVPGVQITRTRGEGENVLIRGLSGVMTTINGSQSFTGADRGGSLNTIQADLVGAIEVYKTRTPDQIEGSETGVVNVTLRRPTDFKEGATYALSGQYDYADQVRQFNPTVSAIVGYNGDTSLGQMGFLVNGSFTHFRYNESNRWNGWPGRPSDNRQIIEPSTTPADIFMPSAVGFNPYDGFSRRAALNISSEWRPDEHWRIVVEGGFSNNRGNHTDSNFDIPLFDPGQRLSNIVLNDDNRSIKSLTVDGTMPFGPGRRNRPFSQNTYNGRFQVNYKSDRIEMVSWLNYFRSNDKWNSLYHWVRFNQSPSFDVAFNTDKDPRGGPDITFKNVDLMDPQNYRYVDGFAQDLGYRNGAEKEAKVDLQLNTFGKFIPWFKVGFRYATRNYATNAANRAWGELRIPMSSLPGYELAAVPRAFAGSKAAANASWLIGSAESFRNAFPTFISLIGNLDPVLKPLTPAYNWWQQFGGSEESYAVYGMFQYNTKILFPIDGVVGLRAVNALNNLQGVRTLRGTEVINGISTRYERREPAVADGNFLDLMPSVNAIVHFTDKLQLRLAYTGDVGRPRIEDLSPVIDINVSSDGGTPTASGGNPNLGPVRTTKYDASLEWYFGRTGSMSLAVWQWNQEGLAQNFEQPEFLPQNPLVATRVNRPRNLGKGRFRGIEVRATTFFSFLPGFLKSFGIDANATMNMTRVAYPQFKEDGTAIFTYGPYPFVSKFLYNIQGFYEKAGLNVRLAYSWQSRQQVNINPNNAFHNVFADPVERLDAQVSYDFTKNLSLAVQANNLTRAGWQTYYGTRDLPQDVRYFSRQYSARATLRF